MLNAWVAFFEVCELPKTIKESSKEQNKTNL